MKNYGLAADIGGTNARFGLVDLDSAEQIALPQSPRKLVAKDYASLTDAVRSYLSDLKLDAPPRQAVLAIAGPVGDGTVSMTNSGWRFSARELGAALAVERVRLINDYEAIAYAIPHLAGDDLKTIGPVRAPSANNRTFAIVGPGTGLGVGGGVRLGKRVVPLVTEGGHADFAPTDDIEIEILKFLRGRYGHVSNERILSGPGLVNLHEALAAIDGVAYEKIDSHAITAQAQADPNSLCGTVFARFCAILGSVCGDVALMMGARDSVFLAGGILPAMEESFAAGPFRERFEAKGRFRDYLRGIPTLLIVQDYAGLIGAAAALRAGD